MAGFLTAVLAAACGYAASPLCEVDTATFDLISHATVCDDARLPFEQRIAPLRQALLAQPDNIFLHHGRCQIGGAPEGRKQ